MKKHALFVPLLSVIATAVFAVICNFPFIVAEVSRITVWSWLVVIAVIVGLLGCSYFTRNAKFFWHSFLIAFTYLLASYSMELLTIHEDMLAIPIVVVSTLGAMFALFKLHKS